MKTSEEGLALRLQAWLTAQGWDCYPEVQLRSGEARVDLVATREHILHAIEVKTSASLAVLEQAMGHRGRFHLVSVATPYTKSEGFRAVCRSFGIGWLRINDEPWVSDDPSSWRGGQPARIEIAPRLDRSAHDAARRLRARLSPDHKRFAPGNASCSYWTPYRATCEQILREVMREPQGVPLRELVRRIKHHYGSDATAVSCLRRWIHAGKVPGVIASGTPLLVRAVGERKVEVAG